MYQKKNQSSPRFAAMLSALGYRCVNVQGIYWYEYNSFLRPACLPHCCPPISVTDASQAIEITGLPFARWETDWEAREPTHWWCINRYPPYDMASLSGNTRSKIRRGQKRYHGRLVTPSEISTHCFAVCEKAVSRFGDLSFLPLREELNSLADAAAQFPDCLEVFGVFCDEKLIGFSGNYVDGNAVLIDKLWYDPEHLSSYSSYVLVDAMLSFYLNDRKVEYLSDGSRNLHHQTNVHDFLVQKFGFVRVGATLNLCYARWFGAAVRVVFPFRAGVSSLASKSGSGTIKKIDGILRQEEIARRQG